MIKRKWIGDACCQFCDQLETINHIFFLCPVAKVIWIVVGSCFGANNVPLNIEQYKVWIKRWLPHGESVRTFGLAAICWAVWKATNKACFEKKLLKTPIEILTHACVFMQYWAGLYGADMQGKLLDGVKVLLACAHWVMAQQSPSMVPRLMPPEDSQEEDDE